MKNIIVNASASSSGGAATIISQFIHNIPQDGNNYYIFCKSNFTNIDNKYFINTNTQGSYVNRFLWEIFGIWIWMKKNKIYADLFISFQNTGLFFNNKIPQIVYYHQPVTLFNYKWNLLLRRESILFFYKKIYPLIVKMSINNETTFVVQLNCIKDSFSKYFKINSEKIHVIRPTLKYIDKERVVKINLDKSKRHFFYPCVTISPYKNFKIIFDSIKLLPIEILNSSIFHFSCSRNDLKYIYDLTDFPETNLKFHDNNLSYENVLSMYKSVDVIIFPSFIETFGLPLIEGSFFQKPIIVSDLAYSREVLQNYNNVKFVDFNNAKKWAEAIQSISINKIERYNVDFNKNEWVKIFKLINIKLNTYG